MKKWPVLLCALALLAGCKGGEEPRWTPPPLPSAPAPSPTAKAAWWEALTEEQLPTALAAAEALTDLGAGQVVLLGRGSDSALYGLGGASGILLAHGGALAHFDQRFAAPGAAALPELYTGDYDGDGEDELAVRYLMEASGDRIVYDLHIYDWTGGSAADCPVTQAECAARALDEVTVDDDRTAGTVTLSYGRSSTVCRIPDGQGAGRLILNTGFFRETDGVLTVVLGAGISPAGAPFANILADIAYDGANFTLENIKVEPTTGV